MDGLGDMTPEEVRVGVLKIRSMAPNANDEVWPPDLPEFRAMCRPHEDDKRVQTYSNRNFTEERIAQEKKLLTTGKASRSSEIAKREMKRQAAIAASPKSREPSEDDVETLEESYNNLHLSRRMGPL